MTRANAERIAALMCPMADDQQLSAVADHMVAGACINHAVAAVTGRIGVDCGGYPDGPHKPMRCGSYRAPEPTQRPTPDFDLTCAEDLS